MGAGIRKQTNSQAADALNEISKEAREFRDSFYSLQLATASINGTPNASYAPFVQLSETQFGIYISELAVHTQNLLSNPRASVMFIEPEDPSGQHFSRKRLVYQCDAIEHDRGTDAFDLVINALTERFTGKMELLVQLKDFHAFTLNATHASYVRGFAQAYEFDNGDLATVRHNKGKR